MTESGAKDWSNEIQRIKGAHHIWLVTHERPDPDGLGAMLGLAEVLDQTGASTRLFAPHAIPEPYHFLEGWERVEVAKAGQRPVGASPDLVILVDANLASRVGRWPTDMVAISVDHHVATEDSIPGIIAPDRSSASEVVYELIEPLGGHLTKSMAHNLYTGILFDTRSFRFIQGHPRALSAAAALIPHGVDTELVFNALFTNLPAGFLTLTQQFLDTLRHELDGSVAWGTVSMRAVQELGVDKALLQELLPFMLMVGEVQVAILYRELESGQFKASLRSKRAIDVRSIAERHGGGGHRNAAGVMLDMRPEEHVRFALPLLRPEIKANR